MTDTKIMMLKEPPKLKDPLFIVGLPGVGNVGRIAVTYLMEQLKAEKFAELYSSHFMPIVILQDNEPTAQLVKNELYFWKAKKRGQRNLIFLVGDMQSADPRGHYEIVETVLNFLENLNVKEILTIGGFNVGKSKKAPRIIGVVNDPGIIKRYKKYDIDFEASKEVGQILGAAGLFLGLGKYRDMQGLCLLGETVGFPIIPDPKSAEVVLKTLMDILSVKIDLSKLHDKAKEMEEFMKKVQRIQSRAIRQMLAQKAKRPPKEGEEEELKYIG